MRERPLDCWFTRRLPGAVSEVGRRDQTGLRDPPLPSAWRSFSSKDPRRDSALWRAGDSEVVRKQSVVSTGLFFLLAAFPRRTYGLRLRVFRVGADSSG